jgi:hypothetical protein
VSVITSSARSAATVAQSPVAVRQLIGKAGSMRARTASGVSGKFPGVEVLSGAANGVVVANDRWRSRRHRSRLL